MPMVLKHHNNDNNQQVCGKNRHEGCGGHIIIHNDVSTSLLSRNFLTLCVINQGNGELRQTDRIFIFKIPRIIQYNTTQLNIFLLY